MNLQDNTSRLMVVRLTRHQWQPRKLDRKASNQVTKANGAAVGAARVWKSLLDKDSMKELQAELTAVYQDHMAFTSPWSDDGVRVLASELFFDYTEMTRKRQAKIEQLAREFEAIYPQIVEAARTTLGDLFNEDDYPSANEIRNRFGLDVKFEPLPNPEDTRVWGIGSDAAKEIEQQVRDSMEESLADSQKDIVERVEARAKEFIERVTKYDDGDTSRLYASAIENLRDVTGLVLRGLNVAGDAQLEKLAKELNVAFDGINIGHLKNSESARKDKTAEVKATLAKFKGVF